MERERERDCIAWMGRAGQITWVQNMIIHEQLFLTHQKKKLDAICRLIGHDINNVSKIDTVIFQYNASY